jgi:(2Fe-2S) ferredoxin
MVVDGVVYDAAFAPLMLFHVEVAFDSAFCHWYDKVSPYVVDAVVEKVAVEP